MMKIAGAAALIAGVFAAGSAQAASEICSDKVGGSVLIHTESWENRAPAQVEFFGESLVSQLFNNCYPDGVQLTDGGYLLDAVIKDGSNGTEIGLSYARGESLCSLAWSGETLQMFGPRKNKVLWTFDNGCLSAE